MARSLTIVISLCFFVIGCQALKIQRSYENQIFSSSNPRLTIKTKKNYSFLGEHHSQTHEPSGIRYSESAYILAEMNAKKVIEEGLLIRIISLNNGEWHIDGSVFDWMSNKFDAGTVTLAGRKYYYAVGALPGVFTSQDYEKIKEQGCRLAPCYLVYAIAGVTSYYENGDGILLYFIKDMRHYKGLDLDCSRINQIYLLNEDKNLMVQEFSAYSQAAFEFVK